MTINTFDLFNLVSQLIDDEVEAVDFDFCDDFISVEAPEDDFCSISYDSLDDINSDDYSSPLVTSEDSPAPLIPKFKDLFLTANAFHNAIENCKTELKRTDISASERSAISSDLKEFDQYLNSLESFLSLFADKV